MSVSAYKRTLRETQSPRDVERQILSRVTTSLSRYAKTYDEAVDTAGRLSILSGGLSLALAENIRLWSLLKSDLQAPDNKLPAELRAQLISLAYFVERQTNQITRGEGNVQSILSINRSIIDGLAGIAPEAA